MKKLLLVDGSGYIFRAFYALPPMTNSKGTPVGAVFGFTKMLMRLLRDCRADYFAVVFDASRKNFRNDIYPAYKGTRKETPEDLIPQFSLIRDAVKVFNVPSIELEGYEADDLIASYAKKALNLGIEVTVVSSDKDMMQLVSKGVILYDPMKQKRIGDKEIKEKFGVTSEQVLDVMSLVGDVSDNVPGVTGIGPKTASELILEYGTLENLLLHKDSIKQKKRKEAIVAEEEKAILSKRLIMLAEDAPLPLSLEALAVKEPECLKIKEFIDQQGFKSLRSIIEDWCDKRKEAIPLVSVSKEYELVDDIDKLRLWINRAYESKVVSVDTETTGLNPFRCKLVGISLAVSAGKACYIPIRHIGNSIQKDLFGGTESIKLKQLSVEEVMKEIVPLFADKRVLKVGHNLKFDMHVFAQELGKDLEITPIDDSMVMSYVLNGSRHGHGMDELAKEYLDYETIKYSDVCGTGKNKITFDRVDLDRALEYAAEDADITLRLFKLFRKRLVEEKLYSIYEEIDLPLISILFSMEERGVCVDTIELKKLSIDFTRRMSILANSIYKEAGEEFNINSPMQLGKILFEKQGLSGGVKSSVSGAWVTDAEVLDRLSNQGVELAKLILEYRQLSKLKSTYSDALLDQVNSKTSRVHTTFSQTVTSTGRLSSNDPNLQNIPIRTEEGRNIRRAFIADRGKLLISADYSQVELRLMAAIGDVKGLKEAFEEGIDIHASTASQVFGVSLKDMDPMLRRRAKAINFGIIYGISAFGLSRQLEISRTEASSYIESYFSKYPEIKDYMERTIEEARQQGYVTTIFGRRCYVEGIMDKNPSKRGFAERAAINAPIQGSAADILKKAMQEVSKELTRLGYKDSLLLQVHDELILEVDKDKAEEISRIVKGIMERTVSLSVPLIAEAGIGENWATAH